MESIAVDGNTICQYFVLRKKRFCRMTVKIGQQFCGEHIKNDTVGEELQRVVCPYDKKHTCYVEHLAKHLKKCNAKPSMNNPSYIKPGINCTHDGGTRPKSSLAEITDDALLKVIEKVKHIVEESLPTIPEMILDHPALLEEVNKPENGVSAKKHLLQNSSLLGHLQKSGLIKGNTCYIEFGAGKGQLSYWLGNAIEEDQKSMLLLVDRASHRHKFDNRKRDPSKKLDVLRIRADIADLSLNHVDEVDQFGQVVAISKHLCGAATDLALQCLVNSIAGNATMRLNITGIMMAFCCHHRCDWSTYFGKSYLASQHLTDEDFNIMCGMVSWATCGSGRSRTWQPPSDQHMSNQPQPENDRYSRLQLSQEERKLIGRQCKLILDYGRLQRLQENGFRGELVYYISEEISPENLCIIAKNIPGTVSS